MDLDLVPRVRLCDGFMAKSSSTYIARNSGGACPVLPIIGSLFGVVLALGFLHHTISISCKPATQGTWAAGLPHDTFVL